MADKKPSWDEIERLVKSTVAALAGVDAAKLNETTVLDDLFPDRALVDRHLAASLRGFVAFRGGNTITAAEVRNARTIRDIIDIIFGKWS